MIEIRTERPDDVRAIREVNERAFGGPAEAILVDRLRAANKAVVSLVAERDDQVVGHILFSPVTWYSVRTLMGASPTPLRDSGASATLN